MHHRAPAISTSDKMDQTRMLLFDDRRTSVSMHRVEYSRFELQALSFTEAFPAPFHFQIPIDAQSKRHMIPQQSASFSKNWPTITDRRCRSIDTQLHILPNTHLVGDRFSPVHGSSSSHMTPPSDPRQHGWSSLREWPDNQGSPKRQLNPPEVKSE